MRVGGTRQHADIGAGAEHAILARPQQHRLDRRIFEPQALECIEQFDIDAEIVGIELELVTFKQAAIFIYIHGQAGDIAIDIQLPMAIGFRARLKVNSFCAIGELAFVFGHVWFPHQNVFDLSVLDISMGDGTMRSIATTSRALRPEARPGNSRIIPSLQNSIHAL